MGDRVAEALKVAIWDHRSPAEVKEMLTADAKIYANRLDGELEPVDRDYLDKCLGYGPLIRNVKATTSTGLVRAQASVPMVGTAIFFVWFKVDTVDPAKIAVLSIESYPTAPS